MQVTPTALCASACGLLGGRVSRANAEATSTTKIMGATKKPPFSMWLSIQVRAAISLNFLETWLG